MALRIVCGWCRHPTAPGQCGYCGHDPGLPWLQRGEAVPTLDRNPPGHPSLAEPEIRRRYERARSAIIAAGKEATVERLADALDRSPRTVRQWRQRFGL